MRVKVNRPSISIAGGIYRRNDVVDGVTEAELRKKLKRYPDAFEILPEEKKPAPKKRGRKKRAHNEDGTFKADNPATPGVNEAWSDE